MRHRKKTKILDRKKAPREAMLNNLACQLVLYEKISTTEAKARALRPYIEKLVTKAKKNTVANRRLILSKLPIKKSVKKLFDVLGPRYQERAGGYTRIIKTSVRKSDGAQMAVIEFV